MNEDDSHTGRTAGIADWIRVLPHYLIPQHALTRLTYHFTRCRFAPLKNALIRSFIALFKPDMSEAVINDYRQFETFNEFFTRALKPEARPVSPAPGTIISPVDGSISQIGLIKGGEIFQAKNRHYDLAALLADDQDMVNAFQDGLFATLYLSPRDYHRIHMPISGTLKKMIYVPGRLFSVNTRSVKTIKRLFARNERVINYFETDIGPMTLIMVGAMNVGSMETTWAGAVTPARNRAITAKSYNNETIKLERGEEMGRFNMGSTVILLFGKGTMHWLPALAMDQGIKMGMPLGVR